MRLLWLSDELRRAGLRVNEVTGWQQRGYEPFSPRGLVCFSAGTLVLCRRGLIPIENVLPGDEALTHEGRWRRITALGSRLADVGLLKGQGHPGLTVTPDHPFLARETGRHSSDYRSGPRRWFSDPEWTGAADMPGQLWASPTDFPIGEVPHVESRGREVPVSLSSPLMFLAGRYMADGSLAFNKHKNAASVHIHCGLAKVEATVAAIRAMGRTCSVQPAGNCAHVVMSSAPLARWLAEHFGRGALEKTVPAWALGMPEEWRRELWAGYRLGDGYESLAEGRAARVEALTVSRRLAVGLKLLVQSLRYTTGLYLQRRAPTKQWPDGSVRAQHDTWLMRATQGRPHQQQCFEKEGWLLTRAKTFRALPEQQVVYNIEVEGDESYFADGIAVHNCHHTAGRCDHGSLGIVTNGRSGLPGPLAQLLLACDGTYYCVASGRANHAGAGGWRGLRGNSSVVGIEAEGPGTANYRWPQVQLDAYYRGVAVIARRLGFPPEMICAHREWAPSRKVDPANIDMADFRRRVATLLRGGPPPPAEEDEDMKPILFRPVAPVIGKLQAGRTHVYLALPNGTSTWVPGDGLRGRLVVHGAVNEGDVGDDWFATFRPANGPHALEYSGQ